MNFGHFKSEEAVGRTWVFRFENLNLVPDEAKCLGEVVKSTFACPAFLFVIEFLGMSFQLDSKLNSGHHFPGEEIGTKPQCPSRRSSSS